MHLIRYPPSTEGKAAMFREMRRSSQLLSNEKDVEILTNARRGVLSVLGDDGYPYGVPVNFVYDPSRGELGTIFFHAALSGHKLDAMKAYDKVSFCAMDEGYQNEGEWWYYVNSVICFCRASVIEDPQLKHDALAALARKYFPPQVDIEGDIAKNGDRIYMIELRVEHMTGKIVQEK